MPSPAPPPSAPHPPPPPPRPSPSPPPPPPPRKAPAVPAPRALAAGSWPPPGALGAAERAAKDRIAPPPGFPALDERRSGAARLAFLRYGGGWAGAFRSRQHLNSQLRRKT